MRKLFKKYFILILTVCCICVLGLVGCKDNDDDSTGANPPEVHTVTISKETLTLDIYEEYTLTATSSDGGAIVWTSSNPTVATVDGGVVSTWTAGIALITATSGTESASCTVTVTNSYSAPVLSLNPEFLAIAKDASYPVEAEVLYKGEAIESEIVWTVKDGEADDVVTMTQDGSVATFTGVKYGTTTYVATTTCKGSTVSAALEIKVASVDVVLNSSNMEKDRNNFVANLALLNYEDHVSTLTPDVSIVKSGAAVSDPDLTWTSDDESVAKVESGSFVAVGEGTTYIHSTFEGNAITVCVNVYKPEISMSEVFYLETYETTNISVPSEVEGAVTDARLDDKSVFASYEDGVVTVQDNSISTAVSDMGAKTLKIVTEKAVYVYNSMVVTKAIRTESDLNGFMEIAETQDDRAYFSSGYFVLANNINCTGDYTYVHKHSEYSIYNPQGGGFYGIFDGQGYTIKNFHPVGTFGGLVPWIGGLAGPEVGIVRNVAFENATQDSASGIIACRVAGKIDNVYISVHAVGNDLTNQNAHSIIANDANGWTRISNVFIEYLSIEGNAENVYPMYTWSRGYNIFNNVYAVGIDALCHDIVGDGGAGDDKNTAACLTYSDLNELGPDFSSWTNKMWEFYAGYPYPKTFETKPVKKVEASVEPYAQQGETVQVSIHYTNAIEVSTDAANLGVLSNGSTIILPETIPSGTTVEFTVYSVFYPEEKTELSFVVVGSESIELSTKSTVETARADTISLDLSEVKDKIPEGSTVSATIDETVFTNVSYDAATGIVSLDSATVKALYGDNKNIIVTFTQTSNDVPVNIVNVNVPVELITLVIMNVADLNSFPTIAESLNATENVSDGYFVLGANIVYNADYTTDRYSNVFNDKYFEKINTKGTYGFQGIFDGRGYTIENFHPTTNQEQARGAGLVLGLGIKGVIRNIVFKNALGGMKGGIICTISHGKVENIYISVTMKYDDAWNGLNAGSILCNVAYHGATFNKIYIDVLGWENTTDTTLGAKTTEWGYVIKEFRNKIEQFNGVFVVGAYGRDSMWHTLTDMTSVVGEGVAEVEHTDYGQYADVTAFKQSAQIADWDNDFWDIVDGVPVPTKLNVAQ